MDYHRLYDIPGFNDPGRRDHACGGYGYYSPELRRLCEEGMDTRKPDMPTTCPRCREDHTFTEFKTYKAGLAGTWGYECHGCGDVHWPRQRGPPRAQLKKIAKQRAIDERRGNEDGPFEDEEEGSDADDGGGGGRGGGGGGRGDGGGDDDDDAGDDRNEGDQNHGHGGRRHHEDVLAQGASAGGGSSTSSSFSKRRTSSRPKPYKAVSSPKQAAQVAHKRAVVKSRASKVKNTKHRQHDAAASSRTFVDASNRRAVDTRATSSQDASHTPGERTVPVVLYWKDNTEPDVCDIDMRNVKQLRLADYAWIVARQEQGWEPFYVWASLRDSWTIVSDPKHLLALNEAPAILIVRLMTAKTCPNLSVYVDMMQAAQSSPAVPAALLPAVLGERRQWILTRAVDADCIWVVLWHEDDEFPDCACLPVGLSGHVNLLKSDGQLRLRSEDRVNVWDPAWSEWMGQNAEELIPVPQGARTLLVRRPCLVSMPLFALELELLDARGRRDSVRSSRGVDVTRPRPPSIEIVD
ncbi:hypothetical protein OH77DRAFT_1522033 [Trametes cingulata]|nr:hypothetical protein OH77DRAFT_1522033 [Trametes cingulata]